MKLAASQIGFEEGREKEALAFMAALGYTGLEIAPTLAVGENPYNRPQAAADYAKRVYGEYGLRLCSMQSLWYGRSGSIFGPERADLLAYGKKAVDFAHSGGIANLVFGCPKNRIKPEGAGNDAAVVFFRQLGEYAHAHGCVLALEPNPPIYGTNFMNTTPQAFAIAKAAGTPGVRVNLDFGTMVENGEDVAALAGCIGLVSHVHISEPGLVPVQNRQAHRQLAASLRREGYGGYVSLEMKRLPLEELKTALAYVADVFGGA